MLIIKWLVYARLFEDEIKFSIYIGEDIIEPVQI